MLKKLIIGGAFAAMLAAPAFAQAYNPDYGTGNTINLPAAEATNGAVGVGATVADTAEPQGNSAFAYVPRASHVRRHTMRRHYSR